MNYTNMLEEMNKTIVELKDSYEQLYKIVKSSNYIENVNNSKKIIDIKSWKKHRRFKAKRSFNINEEEIFYDDLERTSICEIPLNFGKIKEFKPELYEKMV